MRRMMIILALFFSAMLLGACGSVEKESAGNGGDASQGKTASEQGSGQTEKAKSTEESGDMGGETASLQILEDDKVGEYLADSKGMALYYFKKDEPETSNCSGECLDNWPPFTEKDFDVPEGFERSDFGTITREDTDAEQVTYKGYPLYYFAKDQNKGDVNGQGVKDVWYLINKDTDFK